MLMIGLGGDKNKIEHDGYYEDAYVKTLAGWKFKSPSTTLHKIRLRSSSEVVLHQKRVDAFAMRREWSSHLSVDYRFRPNCQSVHSAVLYRASAVVICPR